MHGTSAHVKYKVGDSTNPDKEVLSFLSGGEKYENFVKLFDQGKLLDLFQKLGHREVTVYGEAYGGKCQGMSATYGKDLAFIAFEVNINDVWLDVPNAESVCQKLGIEFVPYLRGPATIEFVDSQRDADSIVAIRRGCGEGKKREGVVIRPIEEMVTNNDHRVMAKHKRDEFRETTAPRKVVSADKLELIKDAQKIADEWVTDMRLKHVLDKMPDATGMEKTREVIRAMQEDVIREAKGEIVEAPQALAAIGKKTATMFREYLVAKAREHVIENHGDTLKKLGE